MADAEWARVVMRNGETRVDITRLTDGRVMCQECFRYTQPEDLWADADGQKWDICKDCGIVYDRAAEHGP